MKNISMYHWESCPYSRIVWIFRIWAPIWWWNCLRNRKAHFSGKFYIFFQVIFTNWLNSFVEPIWTQIWPYHRVEGTFPVILMYKTSSGEFRHYIDKIRPKSGGCVGQDGLAEKGDFAETVFNLLSRQLLPKPRVQIRCLNASSCSNSGDNRQKRF